MALETLRDVFCHHLGDAYHAEQQILAVLDAVELDATVTQLRDRVRGERESTLRRIDTLERCFELVGTSPPRVESELVRALLNERRSVLALEPSPGAVEAFNVLLLGRLAALMAATYRQLGDLAGLVRQSDAGRLLARSHEAAGTFAAWLDESAAMLLGAAAGSAPTMA